MLEMKDPSRLGVENLFAIEGKERCHDGMLRVVHDTT